ncbi:M14 family metallopeptidase [Flavobacterium luminosum]|uniref:M14 family metallopeptidase n=1 Tax=Flavobacterium luminosum TaxID=2949086 RepID=A0ABT0TM74_9FLAO|nr:M14 family metallopeptidase [Flavobacterium sp. HXWNR70]MCL9808577.1 M14 family metallopeptidase [Flavobacterium sp. HXWNR70]
MKKLFTFLVLSSFFGFGQTKYQTFFEKGNGNQSATYKEVISFFQLLDRDFKTVKMQEMSTEDSGNPLHIVSYSADGKFDYKNPNKSVVLVINAIHAGEPDGVDASMLLLRDLATSKISVPQNTILVVVPVYNIGGLLNRNSTWRTNQNGPEEYGFRGNSRNYDLNRDMIKADTKNTKALIEIFHAVTPDVFIDNHVSNGADYQYVLTFIQTEPSKIGKELGDFMNKEMIPSIENDLKSKNIESAPYVNVWGSTPDKGFAQFNESPRYTTGYTSLFNTIGYVVETHMWKDYASRVKVTYEFMVSTLKYADSNVKTIKEIRKRNADLFQPKKRYPYAWVIDSSKVQKRRFLGYEGKIKKSDVTTGNRLYYDRSQPFDKEINFYTHYKPTKDIVIPDAYIVPKAWFNIVELLKLNQCQYKVLKKDSVIEVESYRIVDYKTSSQAYEGHYLHRNTVVSSTKEKIQFFKGDYIFPTNQPAIKYLLEVLEPEMVDSFFNWNFFDTILQQKEGYSDYLFEDLAAKLFQENPELKKQFEEKLKRDPEFLKNPPAQLDWIHKNSVYYEKAHLQYPIYRIVN